MPLKTADNNFGTAKWIVSANYSDGCTHTTIATALTSASSGDTIFIRTGTYTENITLKAGVNLVAYDCDATTPNVTILGTCSFALAGTVGISGINLKTNSANCLSVTGSAASIVNLINCNIDVNNNTAISFTTSNTSAAINLVYCTGTIDTTGIAIHSMSSTGNLRYRWCSFGNAGLATTASSNSAGSVLLDHSAFGNAFSTSSTGQIVSNYTSIDCTAINTIGITTAGTGQSNAVNYGVILSGSASTLSIGSGTILSIFGARLDSTNTNNITGAGAAVISGITFTGSSNKSNVTTQTGGAISGLTQGTVPSAGFIGEQIRSLGTGVSLTSTVAANVTSISITAGVWDVSAVVTIADGSLGLTFGKIGISVNTASFTGTASGDSLAQLSSNAILANAIPLTIASFRVVLSATTTYFLVAQANGAGTITVDGRISATRVG